MITRSAPNKAVVRRLEICAWRRCASLAERVGKTQATLVFPATLLAPGDSTLRFRASPEAQPQLKQRCQYYVNQH